MSLDRDFIDLGLKTAREALEGAAGLANLHLRPETITKCAARKFKQTLKAIEVVIRQLIVLLAASLELAPLRSRPARTGDATPHPPRPRKRGFRIFRVKWHPGRVTDFAAIERKHPPMPGPYRTGQLLDRIQTVFGLLRNPEPAARRVARQLERLKLLRVARPEGYVPKRIYRFGYEFGLIAAILPELFAKAFKGWYDTS